MLTVTELAHEKLAAYLQTNNVSSPLRVTMLPGGCQGSALGLALDEQSASDQSFDDQGLTFLVDKSLLEQCGSITVDYIDADSRSGFMVRSANPLPQAGSSCNSGSCSSGGCGC